MEDTSEQPPDRYVDVSSLYGPGAIACWYLTILSVLFSWTLHPKKRRSGSIDVDLIAILTLPAVAAGHLILQVSTLMDLHSRPSGLDTNFSSYARSIAAIEAPFSVIESFLAISVAMFLVAVWTFCLRRAISVAIVGLLCLAAECYVHFSSFKELGLRYQPLNPHNDGKPTFSRSFVADFAAIVTAILIILTICAVAASTIVAYMLRFQRGCQGTAETEQGRTGENSVALREAGGTSRSTTEDSQPNMAQTSSRLTSFSSEERAAREGPEDTRVSKRAMRTSRWISTVLLPAAMLLVGMPSAGNSVQFGIYIRASTGRTTTIWSRLMIFAAHFYPHSNNSFSDLDQAVATAAGAVILGFSIYSVASARYEMLSIKHAMRVEEDSVELSRLG